MAQKLTDIEILTLRMTTQDRTKTDDEAVQKILSSQKNDGAWPDIDYTDESRSGWKVPRHLSNLTALIEAYSINTLAKKQNPDLKNACLRALDHWLTHDYKNPNWWWNQIGVPRSMAHILLRFQSEITRPQLDKGLEILSRAEIRMTGQNLVWVADITAKRGLLTQNEDLIAQAYARIAEEIRISLEEGVQPDFSFHQHGPCLYNHGYGAGFATDCTGIAAMIHDTRFAFPKEKIDILTAYVLDGSRWMVRGAMPDYGAEGRNITRKGLTARYLITACNNLLELSTGREDDLRTFKAALESGQGSAVTGNKHFWRGDIMCHHRKGYYASTRFFSTRTTSTDGPHNREGLKSHHISDGCMYLFPHGNEYDGIFPVWDWQQIPGTTVAQTGDYSGNPKIEGQTDFAGGVSDGTYGLAAFDLKRDTATARKAWMFFDREIVCLGAGIASNTHVPVVTTLNQCHLNGQVNVDGRAVENGEHDLQSAQSIFHDGVAYIFPQPADVHLHNTSQTGSWWEINNQYEQDTITLDVFNLWIDHGVQPENASYAYIVAPSIESTDVPIYTQRHGIQILANTPELQAAYHTNHHITGIAFYEPGKLDITRDLSISVDQPCLVLLRDESLSVANPKNNPLIVAVTLTGNDRVTTELVELPDGFEAGSTVTLTL